MNQTVIREALVEKGIQENLIQFGWIRDAGPGIHILYTHIYAFLPIDDESDLAFADFIYKEWSRFYGPEKRAYEEIVYCGPEEQADK